MITPPTTTMPATDTRRHEAHGHPGDHAVHDHAHHADVAVFRRRFWSRSSSRSRRWSGDLLQGWLGYVPPGFPARPIPVCSTAALFTAAAFVRGAVDELKRRRPMTLIALAMASHSFSAPP